MKYYYRILHTHHARVRIAKDVSGHLRTQFPSQHFMADDVVTITPGMAWKAPMPRQLVRIANSLAVSRQSAYYRSQFLPSPTCNVRGVLAPGAVASSRMLRIRCRAWLDRCSADNFFLDGWFCMGANKIIHSRPPRT